MLVDNFTISFRPPVTFSLLLQGLKAKKKSYFSSHLANSPSVCWPICLDVGSHSVTLKIIDPSNLEIAIAIYLNRPLR